jgi:hypothetical protein
MLRLSIALIALSAAAQATEISTTPARLTPGAVFAVKVNDVWPNSCVPKSATVALRGSEIVLQANDVSAPDCKAVATPYTLSLQTRLPIAWAAARDAAVLRYVLNRAGAGTITRASALTPVGAAPRDSAESGIYWNDVAGAYPNSGPGVGISLDVQGTRASVTAFYYDLSGNPVWYFGNGELIQDTLALDLHLLRGGQSLLGEYRAPTDTLKVAQLAIKFSSPSRFTALLTVPQGDGRDLEVLSQTQSMVRFSIGYGPEKLRLGGNWAILSATDTLRLELVPNQRGELIDLKRGYTLRCSAEQESEPPPSACVLTDNKDRTVANFDQIGLERMRGRAPGGGSMTAVRTD